MLEKSDSTVIKIQSDLNDSTELEYELKLLGLRTIAKELENFLNLKNDIEKSLEISSSVIILLTNSIIEEVTKNKINLNVCSKKAIFIYFKTNKATREKLALEEKNCYMARSQTIEKLAAEILKNPLLDPDREIIFNFYNTISQVWKSPLYIFKKIEGFDTERKILVDVTWSSKPTRPDLAPSLIEALKQTLDHINNRKCKILDFGAGKLRHSVFLLEQGYPVTSVDFESIYVRPSSQVQGYLEKTKEFDNFNQILYPSEFIEHTVEHDLVLLVNVLGVMPEPLERVFVLNHCHRVLRTKGYVLLFNQHGDADQINAASDKITDGGCTRSKGIKTFYKDYNTQEELIQLFSLAGFEIDNEVDFSRSGNHILLFKKMKDPLFNTNSLIENKRSIINREIFVGETDSEIGVADVIDSDKYIKFGEILFYYLEQISSGNNDAYRYESLIKIIIKYIFNKHFKEPIIEAQYEIDQGRKRIDIKANWKTTSDLKEIVINENNLKSSFVPIECKNYSNPLKNPEYAQIIDRCDKRHRHFAIIICRSKEDDKAVLKHCQDRWNSHDYLIIVLEDSDLNILLKYRDKEYQDKIVEYINKKIEEVRDMK